jgi:hypothetical protein
MVTSKNSSKAKVVQALLAGAIIAVIATASATTGQTEVQAPAQYASLEASMMPARAKSWQRPAPVTWSSRSNVRWEARWGSDAKYMV